MGDREIIAAGLKPMFARAEKDGLWFFSGYQQLWFSPSELKAEQSQGNFMWGAVNWQLRNPQERLQQLEHEIKDKQNEIVQFKKRLAQSVFSNSVRPRKKPQLKRPDNKARPFQPEIPRAI